MPLLSIPLLFLFACDPAPPPSGEDTQGELEEDTWDTGVYGDLNGDRPETRSEPPEFSVQDQHEAWRTAEDLTGHPTLLWFYPRADTGG